MIYCCNADATKYFADNLSMPLCDSRACAQGALDMINALVREVTEQEQQEEGDTTNEKFEFSRPPIDSNAV
jgi:hypothetical protein